MSSALPLIFILVVSAVREICEDFQRYQNDKTSNNEQYDAIRCQRLCQLVSAKIKQGDIVKLSGGQRVPADGVLLCCSNISGTVFINTSSLDGESSLKQKHALFNSTEIDGIMAKSFEVEAFPPNTIMSEFNGSIKCEQQLTAFNIENTLLRGVELKNTQTALLGVLYTSYDTKIMQNLNRPKSKPSRLEQRLNWLIMVLIILSLLLTAFFIVLTHTYKYSYNVRASATRFLQFFIISSYLVPTSLFVTFKLTRFFQSQQIQCDQKLQGVKIRNASAIENLAEVDLILTDKTGTITKNLMTCSHVAGLTGKIYKNKIVNHQKQQNGFKNMLEIPANSLLEQLKNQSQIGKNQKEQIRNKKYTTDTSEDFETLDAAVKQQILFPVGLCQQVQIFQGQYNSESADELALTEWCSRQDLQLVSRDSKCMKIRSNQIEIEYEILWIIPFSSDRKRMSILLKEVKNEAQNCHTPRSIADAGQAFIITKGADCIMKRLITNYNDVIQSKVDKISAMGLRTLIYGARQLTNEEILLWNAGKDRIKQLNETDLDYQVMTEQFEQNLTFQCITGVSDELQDELIPLFQQLRQSKILLWMLTGDQTLTAATIAKAAGMMSENAIKLDLTSQFFESGHELNQTLDQYVAAQEKLLSSVSLDEYSKLYEGIKNRSTKTISGRLFNSIFPQTHSFVSTKTCLLVDSETFRKILIANMEAKFFQLAFSSECVVCSRMSPLEKSTLVQLAHHYNPYVTTLAIGDGANDVAMIKQAQVGIGLAGKEGLQASNAADIAIPELKYLRALFFVHGHLIHVRNSYLVEYCIFKNAILVVVNLLYQFQCKFTAQMITEGLLLTMFNTIITFFGMLFDSLSVNDVQKFNLEFNTKFRQFSKKQDPNIKSVFYVLIRSTYCGGLVYMCYFLVNKYEQHDIYFGQTFIMIVISAIAILQVLFDSDTISLALILATSASFVLLFAISLVGNFTKLFGIGQIGFFSQFGSTFCSSVQLFIIVCLCVLPTFVLKQAKAWISPSIRTELLKLSKTNCQKRQPIV